MSNDLFLDHQYKPKSLEKFVESSKGLISVELHNEILKALKKIKKRATTIKDLWSTIEMVDLKVKEIYPNN